AGVEGREIVERPPLARPVRGEAPLAEEGEAGQLARVAAADQRRSERDRGRFAFADRHQVEARPQGRERLRGRVHASRDVEARRPRAHPGEVPGAGEEVRRVERPGGHRGSTLPGTGAELCRECGAVDTTRQAGMLADRVRKNFRRLHRPFERDGVGAFRVYDWDVPEIRAAVDWYEGHLVVAEYERAQTREAAGWLEAMGSAAASA